MATIAPEAPAILIAYNAQVSAARAAQRAAERDAIASGRDPLDAIGTVRFPRRTPEIIAAEKRYADAYRAAARSATGNIGARRDRPAAVRAAATRYGERCPRCTMVHAGGPDAC